MSLRSADIAAATTSPSAWTPYPAAPMPVDTPSDDAGESFVAQATAEPEQVVAESVDPGPRDASLGVSELSEVAARTRGGRRWDVEDPLTNARNAHETNSEESLREALDHHDRYNWLEGDVRVQDDGTVVMAHDASQEGDGLTLDQWLRVGAVSERGLKLDVKEDAALPALLDAVEASGIPQERIMVNVGAVSPETAREIRSRLPDAWIAFTPEADGPHYSDEDLDVAIASAEAAGGNVTFSLRWDITSDRAIERLKPHGTISVWTAESKGTPEDRDGEIDELRERGVDGIIDLGPESSTAMRVGQAFVRGLTHVFGDDPAQGAKDAAGDTVERFTQPHMLALLPLWPVLVPGSLAWEHGLDAARGALTTGDGLAEVAIDTAADGLGELRDLAARVPGVGGLFD